LAGEAASSANQPPAVEPRKTAEPSKIAPPPGKLASLNSSKARNDLLDFTRDRRARDNPGTEFSDCTNCPVMISVPAGTFMMGSVPRTGLDALFGSDSRDEQPAHNVTIASPFAVGKFEVSFAEWDACVADHGCNGYRPPDEGWGRGNHPVVNVSWNDAQTYIAWLRAKTGKPYRLLSEAEWEYAARGATVSDFYWGATENRAFGKYNSSDGTAPVGSYRSNPFGLYDMAGNVNEWIADCNNDSYNGAPPDGSPWMTGKCSLHGIRGGSWTSPAANLRSANRDWDASGFRVNRNGFRIARGL
jgi:formylglycine-generating enzyme required for sulfatase activity